MACKPLQEELYAVWYICIYIQEIFRFYHKGASIMNDTREERALNETKKLNKKWVKKQGELQKQWSGYYKGLFYVMGLLVLIFFIVLFYNLSQWMSDWNDVRTLV